MSVALTSVRELFLHMEWADALVWNAVRRARPDAEIRGKLHHLHSVQHAYLQIWRGEPVNVPEEKDIPDLEAWARDFHRAAPAYLDAGDESALREIVQIPWAGEVIKQWGTYTPPTLIQTFFQVTMHSAYHRGQVNQRLRALGSEPPLTDLIAWLWKGQPPADWDA